MVRWQVASVGLASVMLSTLAHAQGTLQGVRGGMRYDNWWVAAGLPAPEGDHPLYPDLGQQSGSSTWRCKECHGWDYKGVDGAYGSGSHFTGIGGVFGSTLTPQEMFDLLKFNHGYQNSGMSDQDFWYLVEFLQNYVIDTGEYIDGSGAFVGDVDVGRFGYLGAEGYYSCANCHGEGSSELADLADANPWEMLHKIRIGDAGGAMPSGILGGNDDAAAASIGAYLQAGFPGPVYVGDESCRTCHADYPSAGFFDAYKRSGHPWKIFHTAGETPDPNTWPWTDPPPLPVVNGNQLQWSDVEYVIGNFYWKTRFIDHNGYIYTGSATDRTQWNVQTQRWVPYSAGQANKPFDCGPCHTTGYQPGGNQHGLPGLLGTWTEDGVRCEACHGPSSDHVLNPTLMKTPGGKDCSECHYRDTQFRMPWKNGFMEHHQQGEDLAHSPHQLMRCDTCHDPHRSVVYGDGGATKHCTECHAGNASNYYYTVPEMPEVDCKECHMPFIGKSAENYNQYMGDVRGHIFRVARSPILASQNTYQVGNSTFWKQDQYGQSVTTLDYACLGCHIQIGEPLTMQQASVFASSIHTRYRPGPRPQCEADWNHDGQVNFFDIQNFLISYSTGDSRADLNEDTVVDFFDVQAFLNVYSAGCT